MNVREAKQLLNISGQYNKSILTKAFHVKMKEVHPDIHPEMGNVPAQQVQAAHEVLKSFLPKNAEEYVNPSDYTGNFSTSYSYENQHDLSLKKEELINKIKRYIREGKLSASDKVKAYVESLRADLQAAITEIKMCNSLDDLSRFKDLDGCFKDFNISLLGLYRKYYPNIDFPHPKEISSLGELIDVLERALVPPAIVEEIKLYFLSKTGSTMAYDILKSEIDELISEYEKSVEEIYFDNFATGVYKDELFKQIYLLYLQNDIKIAKIELSQKAYQKVCKTNSINLMKKHNKKIEELSQNQPSQLEAGFWEYINFLDNIVKGDFLEKLYKSIEGKMKSSYEICSAYYNIESIHELFGLMHRVTAILKLYSCGFINYDDIMKLTELNFISKENDRKLMDFITNTSDSLNPRYLYVTGEYDKWIAYVSLEDNEYYFNHLEKEKVRTSSDISQKFVPITSFLVQGKFVGRKVKDEYCTALYEYNGMALVYYNGDLGIIKLPNKDGCYTSIDTSVEEYKDREFALQKVLEVANKMYFENGKTFRKQY